MHPAGACRHEGATAFGGTRQRSGLRPCRRQSFAKGNRDIKFLHPPRKGPVSAFHCRSIGIRRKEGWRAVSGSRRSRGRPRFRIGRGSPIRTGDASHTADCAREPPFAREPGRFRPDVSQFVDAERTGSCRRLERRRNRPLCGERLNTQMHICLREPGRKPAPSVGAIVGTDVLLPALRTHPDSPLGVRHKVRWQSCQSCKRLEALAGPNSEAVCFAMS